MIENEQEVRKLMEKVVGSSLDAAIRKYSATIRQGRVVRADNVAGVVDVQISSSGSILSGIKYQSGGNATIGAFVILISPNPNNPSQTKAIVY